MVKIKYLLSYIKDLINYEMRYFLFLIVVFLCLKCNNASENEKDISPTPVEYAIPDSILVWNVDAEAMVMKKDSNIHDSIITISRVINGLNQKYPQVNLLLLKQGRDTLYVEVPDATYLGEQMGSAGSTAWFDDVVINLTSIPGINYVSFRMETHSHAQSAIISRKKYENWQRQ